MLSVVGHNRMPDERMQPAAGRPLFVGPDGGQETGFRFGRDLPKYSVNVCSTTCGRPE
jgi:hypothetical protein